MFSIVADIANSAYVHNIDPFAVRISGDFGIRWYGVAYAAGFIAGYLLTRRLAVCGLIKLTPHQVGDFIIACILGVMLGGRVGWVLFYSPSALWTFTSTLPFWEMLAINRGGMASHGGVIGCGLAMVWFGRRHGISPWHLFDLTALIVPFGLCFGRLANFVNGELRGQACAESFPLAVKFPQEIYEEWSLAQMQQAIDAADGMSGFSRGDWMSILNRAQTADQLALDNLRFLQERIVFYLHDGNEQVREVILPMLVARHPSQLYQAAAEGVVLGCVLWASWWWVWRKGRFAARAGLTGVSFLLVYGVLRIITEIWRLPDVGIARTLGLSRGQWLSVGMVVAGLLVGGYLLKRKIRNDKLSKPVAAE